MWPNQPESVDLVTFTEKTFIGKLHFLCSDRRRKKEAAINTKPFAFKPVFYLGCSKTFH